MKLTREKGKFIFFKIFMIKLEIHLKLNFENFDPFLVDLKFKFFVKLTRENGNDLVFLKF